MTSKGVRGLKPYTTSNGEIFGGLVNHPIICKLNVGKVFILRFMVSFQNSPQRGS